MFNTKMKVEDLDNVYFEVKMTAKDAVKLIALEEELDRGGYQFDVKFTDNRQAFWELCANLRHDFKTIGLLQD